MLLLTLKKQDFVQIFLFDNSAKYGQDPPTTLFLSRIRNQNRIRNK